MRNAGVDGKIILKRFLCGLLTSMGSTDIALRILNICISWKRTAFFAKIRKDLSK
jgi:hypothetical protein